MEYNKYGDYNQPETSEWNSLQCGFKGATWLVWGAFALIILSVVLRISAYFSAVNAIKNAPMGGMMGVSSVMSVSADSGAATALSVLASAFICVLFFLLARGAKGIDQGVSKSAMVLSVMNTINLVLGLIMMMTKSDEANAILLFLTIVFAIVMIIYYNIIGNQLMAYDGRAEDLGRSFKTLFKFIMYCIFVTIFGFLLVIIGAGTRSNGLTLFGAIVFLLSLISWLFIFFYAYFGVYIKVGQMLDAED